MNRPEIIIADDQPQHVRLVLQGIAATPCRAHVTVLRDGEAVLDRFLRLHRRPRQPRGDLLFLAHCLPGLDATQLLRQLHWLHREDPLQLPPIVVLSEGGDPVQAAEAYRQGASGYLNLSADFRQVLQSVENAVRYWLTATVRPLPVEAGRPARDIPRRAELPPATYCALQH